MAEQEKNPERSRRDWIIILIILLIGFLCVILAGQRAIRFSPTWKMDTDMGSNIDPNSVFLTSRPSDFFEPLDPSILTQPVWINVFLTPGASLPTNIPITSLPTNTPLVTNTFIPTAIISPTNTAIVPSPTNTSIYFPPPTNTPKPPPTNTPVTPSLTADLSITKTNGVLVANNGDTVIYTVRVTNSGPDNVSSAILSDAVASGLSKTVVACSATPGQCITPPSIAQLESSTFALPTLNNGQFYEISISASVTATSGNVTNTATISAPVGINDPNTANNSATDVDSLPSFADLQITITDSSNSYTASEMKFYQIVVTNLGPSNVMGATVSNAFLNGNASSIGWICVPSAGANCSLLGGGDINNESIDLNTGSSVTFILDAQVINAPSGSLVNTATVTAPLGVTDPNLGNNSATDTDYSSTYGNIGNGQDNTWTTLTAPSSIILALSPSAVVNGDVGTWDIIYYEQPVPPNGIDMDQIILEIGDGTTWYTILNWGNGVSDAASSIPVPLGAPNPSTCAGEPDNCRIDPSFLINNTGVGIDLDNASLGIPAGTYPYIRITVPAGSGNVGIDGIYVVP